MTPQFKAWFGKSLVKDAQGNPLRVFHGSNKPENFDTFRVDPKNAHSPYGYYFTDDPKYAGDYSGTTNIGSKTIPVYLKLERPMDFYAFRDLCRAARKDNSNPVEKAMKLGFDGVITSKKHEFNWDDSWGPVAYDPKTYIVFSPKQIKSALGNKGSYNPEDERITEAAKPDVMMNPAFKTWFKNSKVVDQNGKPLPVYHGTKNDFDAFHLDFAGSNNDPGMWGTGFYFSPQIRMSKGYGNKFKRCYLSLQNPLIFGDNHGDIPKELNAVLNRPWSPHFKLTKETANAIRDKMISMGYDGVMQYSNSWKYPAQIVAFYPSQIKLVNGNKGTYDPQNDRIDEIAVRNLPKINWNLKGKTGWNKDFICFDRVPLSNIGSSQQYRSNKIVDEYVAKMKAGKPIDPIWVSPIYEPNHYVIARGTLGGHHRMWALRKLGFTDQMIPVMVYDYPNRKYWNKELPESSEYRQVSSENDELSSDSVPLFTFMTESKAFRNEQMMEKYTTKELGEILFAMLLTIHLVAAHDETKRYCIKTLKFPKFDHIFLSSTDFANAITTLRNAKEFLGQPNIDIPVNELKRYLRGIVVGGNTPAFTRALFFRLQQRLRIKDGKLLTLRRELVDGEGHGDDMTYGRPLYEYLRKYQNKCDVLVLLQSPMDRYMVESVKQSLSQDEAIKAYMEDLQRKIIDREGSLEGMCYDACLEMQKKFPKLKWYEGKVRTKNGWGSHSWMVSPDGTEYDPTISQFTPKYTDRFITKINGKRITREDTEKTHKGDCFKDSFSAISSGKAPGMKQPLSDMENVKLVHGLVNLKDGRRGDHAWIEFNAGKWDFVWEPESKRVINKEEFYKELNAKALAKYSTPIAVGKAIRAGHSGPWHENIQEDVAKTPTLFSDFLSS